MMLVVRINVNTRRPRMVRIAKALGRVKDDLRNLLSANTILEACRAVEQTFRDGMLTPVNTIYVFLLQVLHGNIAISALPRLAGLEFTESAYCQARGRLKLDLLARLFGGIVQTLRPLGEAVGLWHGHRVFHIDGTGVSMPDTPALQSHFGQSGQQAKGCGFPVAHVLAMFDAATGFLIDLIAAPLRTHDLADCALMHPKLTAGDVLIGDRGFCSFAHLALLLQRDLHGLFRIHQRIIVSFRPGRRHQKICRGPYRVKGLPKSRWIQTLGCWDQLVEWFKPDSRPRWMDEATYRSLPESIAVRELRYRIDRPGFRVRQVTAVTTLLDAQEYPLQELAELYLARWRVECNLRHLKITLGMDVLKCKSVDGVRRELFVFGLVYNLVRAVMVQAADEAGVAPDRVSFVDALRWLRQALWDDVPLRLKINPLRLGRFQPRVRKRRPKQYPLMTKPRHELLQALERQRVPA
jgi:hypothetical protein